MILRGTVTNNKQIFEIPDELSLIEFLEVEPVEAAPADGYWCYEVADRADVKLRLSFNVNERSLQTSIFLRDRNIATVSREGAARLYIAETKAEKFLKCDFFDKSSQSVVKIYVRPEIQVLWSTLIDIE